MGNKKINFPQLLFLSQVQADFNSTLETTVMGRGEEDPDRWYDEKGEGGLIGFPDQNPAQPGYRLLG